MLGIKSGNYGAGISRFIHAVFEDFDPYLRLIPEEARQWALQLCVDELAAAKHNITVARHSLETAAKTLITAVALRRHSWLRATSLTQDTRLTIEDLPFDGVGLFHASTDSTLQEIDKNIKTSRTLGVTSSNHQYR